MEPEDLELLMRWENDTPNWEVSGTLQYQHSRAVLKEYIRQCHLDIYQTGQLRFMIEVNTRRRCLLVR
ncbi:MAG: hypothetical protein U5L96_05525 [Owenweeksia sp.]|nr:hypothetical protein [Owenweeksia sp.]